MSNWYRDGTVTLTNGSDVVDGLGTEFIDNVLPGAIFMSPTGLYEVLRAVSDLQLLLAKPYAGPSIAGAEFEIAPTQAAVIAAVKALQQFNEDLGGLKAEWDAGDLNGKGLALKGVKNSVEDLPASGNVGGDGWMVDGVLYLWTGTAWSNQGQMVSSDEVVAARDQAIQARDDAEATSVSLGDRIYLGYFTTPPTQKPISGDPCEEGDRCCILLDLGDGLQAVDHIRSGGAWKVSSVDSVQLALSSGSTRVGTRGSGAAALARTVAAKLEELSISAADYPTLDQGISHAASSLRVLDLPAGVFGRTTSVDMRTVSDAFGGCRGQGPMRSRFAFAGSNYPGVRTGGRYAHHERFSVEYVSLQGKGDPLSAGVTCEDYFLMSVLAEIVVINAAIGFACIEGDDTSVNQAQFNNTFRDLRVINWYFAAYQFGTTTGGSGSVFSNLYAAALNMGSVFRGIEFIQNFSGEVTRLNIERTTFRDRVVNLLTAHNMSFLGVNFEEISLIGSGFSVDESFRRSLFYTSGQGTTKIGKIILDSSHFGGYIVKSLTNDGTMATATVDLMDMQQKLIAGHGVKVGDSCFVDGAAEAPYNGAHVVAATTLDTISFAIAPGTPSPATPEADADCVTINLGNTPITSVFIIDAVGSAGNVEVDGLHIRDCKVVAKNASMRRSLLRPVSIEAGCPANVKFRNISTFGQQSQYSHWLGAVRVAGWSRASNVMTIFLAQRHHLKAGEPLRIYNAASGINGAYVVTSLYGNFGIKVASIGADTALTKESAGRAMLETFKIASVSRSQNYATIRTIGTHTFRHALQAVIRCSDSSFDSTGTSGIDTALVLEYTSDTFKVRNVGPDVAETDATGSAMLIEGGLATSTMYFGEATGLVEMEGFFEFLAVSESGSVPAGGVITRDYAAQLVLPMDTVEILGMGGADHRLNYQMYPRPEGGAFFRLEIGNPTAAAITSPAFWVRYRAVK